MGELFKDNRGNSLDDLVLSTGPEERALFFATADKAQGQSLSALYADINVVPPAAVPLKKDEALSLLQKDLNLPTDTAAKRQFGLERDFIDVPKTTCDARPQSPWVTGRAVADDCGIALKTIYPRVKNEVTQAVVPQPDGTIDWGAAFKYCDDKSKKCVFITNAHVAEDANQVGLVSEDGLSVQYGRVLALDTVHDIAIVDAPAGDTRPGVKIGHDPRVGDPVFTIGHPYGVPGDVVSAGHVLALNYSITDRESGQSYFGMNNSDIFATPGNSGGPEFNKKGEVIGIVSDGGAHHTSASIPIKQALDLLKNINRQP